MITIPPLSEFFFIQLSILAVSTNTRITTYANRIIELEILITINQFIISCLSPFFGNICMAGIRMISITKNEAICRGRGLRKNGQYYFVLLYLHDSNPVNRGKPQCNSEMVQLQRHLNCVFYFRKLCLHSIVYPSQYVLTKQINTKWFSKDKKVFTTQNHYKECTLYL